MEYDVWMLFFKRERIVCKTNEKWKISCKSHVREIAFKQHFSVCLSDRYTHDQKRCAQILLDFGQLDIRHRLPIYNRCTVQNSMMARTSFGGGEYTQHLWN